VLQNFSKKFLQSKHALRIEGIMVVLTNYILVFLVESGLRLGLLWAPVDLGMRGHKFMSVARRVGFVTYSNINLSTISTI
jgi:hypothetical protein